VNPESAANCARCRVNLKFALENPDQVAQLKSAGRLEAVPPSPAPVAAAPMTEAARRTREIAALMKIVGLIPPALAAAVYLLFALGETAGGDASGLGHLVPVVLIGLLIWLGWKNPLVGGISLILLAFASASLYSDALSRPGSWLAPFLIAVAPLLLAGLLLLGAAWVGRRAT
jgi:hypothetical protein